ncbi:hypothetical protein [Pseudomonas sp. UFMG81]|jgi:hypothetical protein|uniref:hypothetical protein n=1 Tax=Pseudomonas sp. UFMG81 TaxID=2745936 RepID=UPI00188F70D3|nr:hypothetical protein [Pseudomonas sp. UFMG81]
MKNEASDLDAQCVRVVDPLKASLTIDKEVIEFEGDRVHFSPGSGRMILRALQDEGEGEDRSALVIDIYLPRTEEKKEFEIRLPEFMTDPQISALNVRSILSNHWSGFASSGEASVLYVTDTQVSISSVDASGVLNDGRPFKVIIEPFSYSQADTPGKR